MPTRFVHQPYADGSDLRDFLDGVAAEPALKEVQIAVAWVKRSGVTRVRASLEAVQARGGTVKIILGIDEGGGTKQGLELAMDVADEAFVFHDRSGRTFHPKIYLASGEHIARLLVGSHNMTAGGVYFNYEAGLLHELDLTLAADKALHDELLAYFDGLRADTACCLPLDQDLFDLLCAYPRFRIGDEDHLVRPATITTVGDEPEEIDTGDEPEPPESPFTSSGCPKRSDPKPHTGGGGQGGAGGGSSSRGDGSGGSGSTAAGGQSPAPTGSPLSTSTPTVLARWSKRMPPSDAQRPPQVNSAVTGNLRLSKAGHDIDHKTYFRDEFFSGARWEEVTPGSSDYEKALVEFDVTISGNYLGPVVLRIDHQPSRVSNQNNVATVLKWGALSALMRQDDHTNEWVVLERLSDGTFRLTVQPTAP